MGLKPFNGELDAPAKLVPFTGVLDGETPATPEPKSVIGELGSGIVRGYEQMSGGLGGTIKGIGDAVGIPAVSAIGKTTADYWNDAAAKNVSSAPKIEDVKNVGDVLRYGARATGEFIPQMVASAAAAATPLGLAGVLAHTGSQEFGSIYNDQPEGKKDLGRAALSAAPAAALDFLPTAHLLKRTGILNALQGKAVKAGLQPESIVKAILKSAGVQTLEEVPTETLQTAFERFGSFKPLWDAEAKSEYLNTAASTAMGMAPIGGIGGGIGAGIRNASIKAEDQTTPPVVAPPVTTDTAEPPTIAPSPGPLSRAVAPILGIGEQIRNSRPRNIAQPGPDFTMQGGVVDHVTPEVIAPEGQRQLGYTPPTIDAQATEIPPVITPEVDHPGVMVEPRKQLPVPYIDTTARPVGGIADMIADSRKGRTSTMPGEGVAPITAPSQRATLPQDSAIPPNYAQFAASPFAGAPESQPKAEDIPEAGRKVSSLLDAIPQLKTQEISSAVPAAPSSVERVADAPAVRPLPEAAGVVPSLEAIGKDIKRNNPELSKAYAEGVQDGLKNPSLIDNPYNALKNRAQRDAWFAGHNEGRAKSEPSPSPQPQGKVESGNRPGELSPIQAHFESKVIPPLQDFFAAFNALGKDRLAENGVMPKGMSATDWLESVRSQQPVWDKGRKSGSTGIQMLSTKDLWPTNDGKGEALRKSMLAAIKAVKDAPGYSTDWIRSVENRDNPFDLQPKGAASEPVNKAAIENVPLSPVSKPETGTGRETQAVGKGADEGNHYTVLSGLVDKKLTSKDASKLTRSVARLRETHGKDILNQLAKENLIRFPGGGLAEITKEGRAYLEANKPARPLSKLEQKRFEILSAKKKLTEDQKSILADLTDRKNKTEKGTVNDSQPGKETEVAPPPKKGDTTDEVQKSGTEGQGWEDGRREALLTDKGGESATAPASKKKQPKGPRNILTDIRNAGGINMPSLISFLDSKEVKGAKGGNRYLRVTGKNGVGLDQMATEMEAIGWQIPRDVDGNVDTQSFADILRGAINADHPIHPADMERMADQYADIPPQEAEELLRTIDKESDRIATQEELDEAIEQFHYFDEESHIEASLEEESPFHPRDEGAVQAESGRESGLTSDKIDESGLTQDNAIQGDRKALTIGGVQNQGGKRASTSDLLDAFTPEPAGLFDSIKESEAQYNEGHKDQPYTVSSVSPENPGDNHAGSADGVREQFALFTPDGTPTIQAAQVAQTANREVKTFTKTTSVVTGHIRTGLTDIKIPEDLAHVMAGIRKKTQENFVIVVTDKNDKIVGIIDSTTGSTNQSIVHPAVTLGAASLVIGAKNVWLVHNHPTGDPTFSPEDRAITERITKAADGSGLAVKGIMAIGSKTASFEAYGGLYETFDIPALARSERLPVEGARIFTKRPDADGLRLTSPEMIPGMLKAARITGNGIILLDGKNRVAGFIPMENSEMGRLKTGSPDSGSGLLIKTIRETNAAAMLAVSTDLSMAKNLGSFGEMLGVKLLDVYDPEMGRSAISSGYDVKNGDTFHDITSIVPLALKELGKLAKASAASLPHLQTLARDVYAKGAQKYAEFAAGMKSVLGKMWDTFKSQMIAVYQHTVKLFKDERGLFAPFGGDIRDAYKKDESVFWHGSPSGELVGAKNGLHVGTYEAAKQALEARIGKPAVGEWDGTREYGKTLLAGKKRMKEEGFSVTGYNTGAKEEDYLPGGKASYSSGQNVALDSKPIIAPVRIIGKMTNSPYSPMSDIRANATMSGQIKKGSAKNGYYYENDGEDTGSISAVVPSMAHVKILEPELKGQFTDLTDRKAKVEIDDSKADLALGWDAAETLGEALYHPELFKAFPEARDIKLGAIDYGPEYSEPEGNFMPKTNMLYATAPTREGLLETITHEVQHWLQERGDFAKGGTPDNMPAVGLKQLHDISPELSWAYGEFNPMYRRLNKVATPEQKAAGEALAREHGKEGIDQAVKNTLDGEQQIGQSRAYTRLAGEEEARRASARSNMTAADRMGTPYDRTDIANPKDLIVKMDGGRAESRTGTLASRVSEAKQTIAKHPRVQALIGSVFDSGRNVSPWMRSVGTMYHMGVTLAAKGKPEFQRVFEKGQEFLTDISTFAMNSEALAPNIFPKMGVGKGLFRTLSKEDSKAISAPLIDGTLDGGGSPEKGRVFTPDELRKLYKLTDKQIGLYDEAREATNQSLDDMAKSLVAKNAKQAEISFDRTMSLPDMAEAVRSDIQSLVDDKQGVLDQYEKDYQESVKATDDKATLKQLEKELDKFVKTQQASIDMMKSLQENVKNIADKTGTLKKKGYFPLMRFGEYTVTTKDEHGDVQYFGMYESSFAAQRAKAELQRANPNMEVAHGVMGKEKFKLYAGMNLEALQLFAEHLDAEETAPYQEYLKTALNNRSAMKRLIHRKGTAGYSEDAVRVLANFITSNARHASTQYNLHDMQKLVAAVPEDTQGDVSDQAVKLYEYLSKPLEEASKLRGYLFFHYLGGSLSAGIVNMTQPFMMTAPAMAQYASPAKVVKYLITAGKVSFNDPTKMTGEIGTALRRAEAEGITAPQEIYQLTAMASNRLFASNPFVNAGLKVWGGFFAAAEAFNRRITFLASYQMFKDNGKSESEAYTEAARMVGETQGVYNKGNRPNWGRGMIGSTLFTFKQFSVMYLELFKRLPLKQKMLMMGTLFLMAGAQGMPGADDAEDLLDTLMQWFGFSWNTKSEIKAGTEAMVGKTASGLLLRGVSSVMPLDIQGRLGMQNLIPGTGILKQSSTDKGRDVQEFFGPVGGLISSISDALSLTATGQYGRAAIAAMPRAAQNLVQGTEMMTTGAGHDKYGRKTIQVSPSEALIKLTGFNPTRIAEEGQVKSAVMQDVNLLRVRKNEIVTQWAYGVANKDSGEIKAAQAKLKDWNHKNPELKITISPSTILQKTRNMKLTGRERFLKAMPKGARQGVINELG